MGCNNKISEGVSVTAQDCTVKIGYCQRWEAGQEFISAVGGASIADIVIHIHFPVQCRHLKAKVEEKNIS